MKMSCEIVDTIGTGDCEKIEKNCKVEENLANVIASELVSEIIENALDLVDEIEENTDRNVGDIIEKMSNQFDMSMTEEKVEEGSHPSTFEIVGDHNSNIELTPSPTFKHPPLEKKSRLTDLVKNSKQLFAKFMLTENKDGAHDTKSEKILRVVDLDCKIQPFKARGNEPSAEEVPLPRSDSDEILHSPDEDDSLDEITLSSSSKEQRPDLKKTMTFPLAGASGKTLMERYRTLKLTADLKKKKWNIGTKIVNYIRKQQAKRHGKGVSDGIEITPQAEE